MEEEKKKENLHAGHRQRMRERFLQSGFDGWQPHEVLEILLYEVLPRVNTNLHGHRLVKRFGLLKNVFEADPEELQQVEGIGPASAAFLTETREEVSQCIRDQYVGSTDLNKYNYAFLADWFMREKNKPVGILINDKDGAFLDFLCLPLPRLENGTVDAKGMMEGIPFDVTNCSYMLFLHECDLLSMKEIFEIRKYTFAYSFILDEVYKLKGKEPVPLLHPECEENFELLSRHKDEDGF